MKELINFGKIANETQGCSFNITCTQGTWKVYFTNSMRLDNMEGKDLVELLGRAINRIKENREPMNTDIKFKMLKGKDEDKRESLSL